MVCGAFNIVFTQWFFFKFKSQVEDKWCTINTLKFSKYVVLWGHKFGIYIRTTCIITTTFLFTCEWVQNNSDYRAAPWNFTLQIGNIEFYVIFSMEHHEAWWKYTKMHQNGAPWRTAVFGCFGNLHCLLSSVALWQIEPFFVVPEHDWAERVMIMWELKINYRLTSSRKATCEITNRRARPQHYYWAYGSWRTMYSMWCGVVWCTMGCILVYFLRFCVLTMKHRAWWYRQNGA